MNSRTQIRFYPFGDNVISTIHHIEADGTERAQVLDVQPTVELKILDDTRPAQRLKGEFIPYI